MKKNKKIKSVSSSALGAGAIIGISIGSILLVGGISYFVYNFVSSDSSGGGGGGGGSSTPQVSIKEKIFNKLKNLDPTITINDLDNYEIEKKNIMDSNFLNRLQKNNNLQILINHIY